MPTLDGYKRWGRWQYPRKFDRYFFNEEFRVEAFINDHLPFTNRMQRTIQHAYVAFVHAQGDGDTELAE